MRNSYNLRLQKIKNYAKKKITRYKEQDSEKVAEYETKIKEIPQEKQVYLDEACFDSYLLREYASTPRGQKFYEKIKGRKYQRTSIELHNAEEKLLRLLNIKEQCMVIFSRYGSKIIYCLNYLNGT